MTCLASGLSLRTTSRDFARASGALGKDEARRFDDEMAFLGKGVGEAVRHPEDTARVAGNIMSEAWNDPLLR